MDAFRTMYPRLCELLAGTVFEADATAAVEFSKSKDDLKAAFQGLVFANNELMWLLCGALVPEWEISEASDLEKNLVTVIDTVGITEARKAYKEKFLVESNSDIPDPKDKAQNARNKLEDVRYEIAVTEKACKVLDSGSIQLEKPISDPKRKKKEWKNSDVFGKFNGQSVRIEVTVLHQSLPPTIHFELDELVKQAEITSGFRISLRFMLSDEGYAERVRTIVELLHENYVATDGKNVEIDGLRFEWKKGAYHCSQETSPFEHISFIKPVEFAGAEEIREIVHPRSVRPVTPLHVLEDYPNPPGVVTSADLPDASAQVPVSTAIRQKLNGKRQQCEDGIINIVAFGNPLQMHDNEVVNAVCGAEIIGIPSWIDKNGVRHSGKGSLQRSPKAPFVPVKYLENDYDRTEYIEPFEKMSAIWHIRLGRDAKNQIISNPNALNPLPLELVKAFSDPLLPREGEFNRKLDGSTPSPAPPENEFLEEEIIWTEVAQNYIEFCGTLTEARSVFENLEQTGLSLDELQRKVDQVWSEPTIKEKKVKFISPTNEEMAMAFVVDCGGYEQAKACLDLYVEEIEGKSSKTQ